MNRNPFRPVKFEDELEPLIYVSSEAEKQNQPGNYFYTGKRGCGKTSTLKMVDSLFRTISVSKYDNFNQILGVYINLNNKVFPKFHEIRKSKKNKEFLTSNQIKNQLTSVFIEKLIIRNLINTIIKLNFLNYIKISIEDEKTIAQSYSRHYFDHGAENLSALIIHIENDLTNHIDFERNLVSKVDTYNSRFEMPFHEFIHDVYEVSSIRKKYNLVRILVDDCEVLPQTYQIALNTLVRTPLGTPTSWSISYVNGKYDDRSTTINNQDLSREERSVRYLDELEPNKYAAFCNRIAHRRLKRSGENVRNINMVKMLGNFDVNELIEDSFKGSVKKRVLDFKRRSEKSLYYQSYLRENGFPKEKFTSPAFRKKNIAAYLGICRKYGLQFRYAGSNPILSLSDGCIRDFLENMAFLFDELATTGKDPIHFLNLNDVIPISTQDKATREAAVNKVSGIKHHNEAHADLVEKFVEFIGHLVFEMQTNFESNIPLTSPERSIIGISKSALEKDATVFNLIKAVELDGYAKNVVIKSSAQTYGFRLHRQFAARFQYSYRNSGDLHFPISIHQLREILDKKVDNPKEWALKTYRGWLQNLKRSKQQSEFDGMDE